MLYLDKVVVLSEAKVVCESPYLCMFEIEHRGEIVVAVLVGDLARSLGKTVRMNDNLTLEGEMKDTVGIIKGIKKAFIIHKMNLPEDAKIGRNLNKYY
jgi:hypothetical protein